jgi:pimeloyl-ACP methyl ester carboxylesterase
VRRVDGCERVGHDALSEGGGVDRTVETRDGRVLMVSDYGEPTGPAMLSFHGSGMGRTMYPPYRDDALERGVRVLAYDRPGLGGSTRRAGYRVADCTEDVRAIADALQVDRLAVWGVSGGGPFALACAATLPNLVWAAASVESDAPDDSAGERTDDPWKHLDAMRAEYAESAAADVARSASVDATIEFYMHMSEDSPKLCAADVAALRGSVGAWFAADALDTLAVGGDGWFDEEFARERDWAFNLADITMPVLIMHGQKDVWVDPAAASRLATAIPGSTLRITEDDGHLSLLNRLPEVTSWLLDHRG